VEAWNLWLRAESERFADLLVGADFEARVPACPDWNVRQLAHHLGVVQRYWAGNVRAADPATRWWDESLETMPPDGELEQWMRQGSDLLLAALADVDDTSPCRTWWGEPATAGAVARHQVQEAAVHRWDAESAVAEPAPIDSTAAADAVTEFVEIMVGERAGTLPGTVTLVSADTGGRWEVGGGSEAAVTLQAPASDLLLMLYERLPVDGAVVGERSLVDALLAAVDTT
jgi:uncharacterized protein (TIGR03083 family)